MSLYRVVETEELLVGDPLILLHFESDNTTTDVHDTGVISKYYDGSNIVYTGLFRDASDSGKYKIFDSLQPAPDFNVGSINTAGAGFTLSDLAVNNLEASANVGCVDINASGNVVISGNLTVNGTTTTINTTVLTVEDNFIVCNSGPSNMKEDSGFINKRLVANIAANDTALETGTASAAGTTTTVTLEAANQHGTSADYYKGWTIKFGGDFTDVVSVTASSATDPPVLTFTPALSGSTTTSTTYELFNKTYVGTVWDESTSQLTLYGFPREEQEQTISTTSGTGNIASYLNLTVADLDVKGAATIESGLTVTNGNLEVVNGDCMISGMLTAGSLTQLYILYKTKTFTTSATISGSDLKEFTIIYLNPDANNNYTLDTIANLSLTTSRSIKVTFININGANQATITAGSGNTIEGLASVLLREQYRKITLVASDQVAGTWMIKG